ncbi:sensor histidine kinase [Kribbella caucasensis]|nr:ATP-binding protein [Kribbella sp. VKM Ac-2527]
MQERSAARRRPLTVTAVVGTAIVVAVFASMLLRHRSVQVQYGLFLFQNGPSAVVLLWMAWLVLRRRPRNTAGRALAAIGVIQVLHVMVAVWADVELVAAGFTAPLTRIGDGLAPADLPLAAAIPLWVTGWLWVPAAVLAATVLPLAFPDGTLSRRTWRPVVAAASAGGVVLMAALCIDGWPTADWTTAQTPAIVPILLAAGGLPVAVAAVVSIGGLLHRWRQTDSAQRQPFRLAGITTIAFAVVAVVSYPWQQVWIPAILVSFNVLIVAYALAVARYRLHDVEPVLGRAAVAVVLSVLVAAVYATVVVGAASLVGNRVDSRLLPLVAVAVVALLIEPARRRTRQLVDRLLFRRHADRSEVMSRLAAHASTAPAADVVAEVTELLVRSTGAARAEVHLEPSAYPQPTGNRDSSGAVATEPILRATVQHQGETFGQVRLYATARADLVSDAPQLLDDVAHTLGVVLRNDRLNAQLQIQLDELQASRRRLVEAHDQARRGLERDIHDGAQTRLISLRIRLATLQARVGQPGLAAELDNIANDVDATIRSLRALARGLHPPLLEQAGLTDALRAHARDLALPVSVTAQGVGRYPRTVEAAAYFSCLEGIQNAVRHSGATTITVDLTGDASGLSFEVSDDGTGFDPARALAGTGLANIDDRMSALGGNAHIHTAIGQGTRLHGTIPAQALTDQT